MIVNFCGVDKAGKTTLVNKVQEELKWELTRYAAPYTEQQIIDNIEDVLRAHEKEPKLNHLYERFHIPEELVYGPIIENRYFLRPYRTFLEERMNKVHSVLIYVQADYDTILKRFDAAGGDAYLPTDQIGPLFNAYAQFLTTTELPYLIVDTSILSVDESVKRILTYLVVMEESWK